MAVVIKGLDISLGGVEIEAGVDLTAAVDVEIVIYGALDTATDDAIENAKKASEKLFHEYGLQAVYEPQIVHWDIGFPTLGAPGAEYPIVVVNGKEVARGRVPTVEEIVDAALSLLGIHEEGLVAPLAPRRRSGEAEAAVAA